ncbi:MAG: metal ABC transporter substrate-binding protein [Alphaproteobacteria bacterium]|nr:metal ABC transporter substrate-binding protein [Alphaproteobacteria bacterium]
MINRRHIITSLIAAPLLWSSAAAVAQDGGKLPVVASFSIVGDFVREIGGERIALMVIVGPGGDGHVYSPTPQDAKTLAAAKLIVINGLKFEGWMDRLIKASGAKGQVIAATQGIKTRNVPHRHGHRDHHGHNHSGQADPHAWQSVANAKRYAANIRNGLIAADPAGKAEYEKNAAAYLARLDALDKDIKSVFETIPKERRTLITSHDAFGYFGPAYGFRLISPVGVSTESEASAKDIALIIREIKRRKASAVFMENVSDPRLVKRIADETGAKIGGTLYSDALTTKDGAAPDYITMMRHNAKTIADALK